MDDVALERSIPAYLRHRQVELGRLRKEQVATEPKEESFVAKPKADDTPQAKAENAPQAPVAAREISPEIVKRKEELEKEAEAQKVKASAFVFRPASEIPRRQFIYGTHLIRRFVSTTIGHGGGGKSALAIAEALAMANGKPLLGEKPSHSLRVWYWNGEDPMEEIERRVVATMQEYRITPEDIGDRLFIDSGRTAPMIIAEQTREGVKIADVTVKSMIETIEENRIDVVIVDPFVSSHRVTENDNNAIETVVKKWAHIAEQTKCAIDLVHHSRKTGGEEVSVEDGRGASALLAAVRSARTVNTMTKDDATRAGITDERGRYFRVDNGKANLAPPSEKATWRYFRSVPLDNGDFVGVPVPWEMPTVMAGLTQENMERMEREVGTGGPWRKSDQAKDKWIGVPIAEALGLDPEEDKGRVKKIVAELVKDKKLEEYEGTDENRNKRPYYRWNSAL
ncbi:AAA family ATPase [Microvirga aerilata]|uniref:AAA family ATPase n=1 Tax=Microvirga aerilata TaxID=670292 RepID=A0A937CX27_9HYPH|nr:AAA family ATPase [Microvirga aerilata]MBL0404698.1 AAA family ATPase [Microvirga aerilata]